MSNIQVKSIFDYNNGRRFQIIVTNPEPGQNFTVHHDVMSKEYVKLKLSEADILQLITELQKNLSSEAKTELTLIHGSKED